MLLDIPIKECNVDGHIKKIGLHPAKRFIQSHRARLSYLQIDAKPWSFMEEVKVFMQLLFHFPCWTWSITLNGKLAQSSLTSSSPPSLLSFVATFLFMDFPLWTDWELHQPIDPMQGARNLLSNKSSFAQNAFQLRELCPFFPVTTICPVLISRASLMFET